MDTKEWKEIKDLKLIDRFISGQSYSLDFAEQYMPQEQERIKRLRTAKCDKIQIPEFMELKLSEDGSVLWCKSGDKQTWENPRVFETQFGKFVSDNQGEFGGQLQTPYSVVGGNFRDVFDYKDKVYAIDSLEHMLRTITVYEIAEYQLFVRCLSEQSLLKIKSAVCERKMVQFICTSESIRSGCHSSFASSILDFNQYYKIYFQIDMLYT